MSIKCEDAGETPAMGTSSWESQWFSFHRNATISPCYLDTYCGKYFYCGIYSNVELDTIIIKITIESLSCARHCFECIILLNPSIFITSVL